MEREKSRLVHIGEVLKPRREKNTSAASAEAPVSRPTPPYTCPICRDGQFVHPRVDGKPDYSRVVPCICVKEKLERDAAERMLTACELPEAPWWMTFEKWEPREELEEAYQAALDLAEGRSKKWVTFMSDSYRGKTHLLIAVCRRWLARGVAARYAYVPLLFEELRRGFREAGQYSYESRFDFFLRVPLLAFDDLGVENPTPWVQEKLDTIIDYRLMHGLPMVVTTNLTMEELPFRIKSRLQRGGRIIYIDSPEYSTWGRQVHGRQD